jgi:hypothetical protein
MDYKNKYEEYTVGYTLIVAYSVGTTNKIHTFGFPKDSVKNMLAHIDNWELHFEKQVEDTSANGVDYTYSMELVRNLYYPTTKSFGTLSIEKSELKELA